MSLSNRVFTFLAHVLSSGIQMAASPRLLGRYTGGAGAAQEIQLGAGLALTGNTLSADGAAPAVDDLVTEAGAGSAPAGSLGEYLENALANLITPGALVTLSDGVAGNIKSLALTAGDWDVSGFMVVNRNGATGNGIQGVFSATSAAFDSHSGYADTSDFTTLNALTTSVIPTRRFSLASTTTIYLIGQADFSSGTVSAAGQISARRVR